MSNRTLLGLSAALLLVTAVPLRADGPVPRSLKGLKTYQVVEQVMAQRQILALTDDQFTRLDDLSNAIRNEKHRFIHQGGKPHVTQHVPMVTQRQAYDRALAILTPEQRERFEAFNAVPRPARRPAARKPVTPHGKP